MLPLPDYDQHVYRVTVSVPLPEIPDTYRGPKDWERLLEHGSIVYITKNYRVRGKRLTVTCDVPVADGWDNRLGRPRRPDASTAIEHIAEALSATGDLQPVLEALAELRRRGTGAQVQRALLEQRGSLRDVVTACVRHTQG